MATAKEELPLCPLAAEEGLLCSKGKVVGADDSDLAVLTASREGVGGLDGKETPALFPVEGVEVAAAAESCFLAAREFPVFEKRVTTGGGGGKITPIETPRVVQAASETV